MSYRTACDGEVYISRTLRETLEARNIGTQELYDAIELLTLPTDQSFLKAEIDLGRIIGTEGVVQAPIISLNDATSYAYRAETRHPSRVVTGMIGAETSIFSLMGFCRSNKDPDMRSYMLIGAHIGTLSPPEIWDSKKFPTKSEFDNALAYWQKNAFVYDGGWMSDIFTTTQRHVLEDAESPWA